MIKEKFELLRKHGKKVVAGLLAATMTIEQVPFEIGGGTITAEAAGTANDPTDELYIPQLFATISYKKTDESQMNNAITLSRLTSQDTTITITTEESGYTIDKPGLHVDTPVIFYSETEKKYFARLVGLDSSGNPMGPYQYADANGLEVVGGVAVHFSGIDGWEYADTEATQSLYDEWDDEDEADVTDSVNVENSRSAAAVDEKTAEKSESTVDTSNAEQEVSTAEAETTTAEAAKETEKAGSAQETEKETKESAVETDTKKEESETEAGTETKAEESKAEATTKAAESVTETETETKAEESATETETETKTEESATETETETKAEESATETETKAEEAAKEAGASYDIAVYDGDQIPTYPYVLEPNSAQMLQVPGDEGYYWGNVKLKYQKSISTSDHPSISANFKFFIIDRKKHHIPEGLEAECQAWIDMEGFTTPTGEKKDKNDFGANCTAGEKKTDPNSFIRFLYSNIDWTCSLKTINGTKEKPVVVWQKNNYASYLLTLKNTSGLVDGKLTEDGMVPDETVFSNYDITIKPPYDTTEKAYSESWQYTRYYRGEDGTIQENPDYWNSNKDESGTDNKDDKDDGRTYTGKWIANDLSNVDYRAEEYDNSGGAVIVDVTDVSKDLWEKIENPDELIDAGGKLIGYRHSTGANFTFRVRNQTLYPPQFGEDDNGKPYMRGYSTDPNKKISRAYRVFVPFTSSIGGQRGDTVNIDVQSDAYVYFGGNGIASQEAIRAIEANAENSDEHRVADTGVPLIDDRPEEEREAALHYGEKQEDEQSEENADTQELDEEDSAQVQADTAVLDETADEQPSGTWTVDEQPGTDTKGLGHRLLQTSSATTYFTLPQYEPSGEKTLQWADAYYAGKKLVYTLENVGIANSKTSGDLKLNFSAPMYRPNVVDTLPDAFDLQEIQFVFPKRLSDDYSKDGKTPADYWLGGTDPLLGVGIVGDRDQNEYPVIEYVEPGKESDKNRVWIPVDREKTGDFKLLSDTAETINGEPANVYSMDLTNYFDELGFYPKLVRINYRCCWVPLTTCLGNVRLVGVSRIAGQRVNTINTNFNILLFKNERLPVALEQGQLTDKVGYFDLDNTVMNYKEKKFSTDPAHVKKSQIEANVFAETEIKNRHNTDPDKLETPITLDYGNYLIQVKNKMPAEGYNVDINFKLNKEEIDQSEDAKPNTLVPAFFTKGIRISRQLLEAGKPHYKREDDGTLTEQPILILNYADGTKVTYTKTELLRDYLVTDPKQGINPHQEYVEDSVYIDLEGEKKNGCQIETFTLSYASFMASDDLKDKFGTSDDENTSGDAEDPMDYLWMRVYGTSSSICEATGTSKVEVTGWKDRLTGQIFKDEDENIYTFEDDGILKFVMAKPTIDAMVTWGHNGKSFSSKQQPVPYQQEFSYDLKLGNDSTAVMYTGTVDLGLDMFTNGDDVPDGLKHRGFVLDCLEFDVKHMLGASADNWAEIDQIEFYDVDDTAANAKPKATFTGQELKQNYVTNGILTLDYSRISRESG